MIKAFIMGMLEFRLSSTTNYEDEALAEAYDSGRAFAHRATLHYWDQQ